MSLYGRSLFQTHTKLGAYMMQKVIVEQNAFQYLDVAPMTLSAKAHRPPYGSDGDYFTKPNPEDIFDAIHTIYHS